MGNCGSGGGSNEPLISLEFGPNPTGTESEAYLAVKESLKNGPEILNQLKNFKGCGDLIREAIITPSPENEEKAWAAVVPSVEILKEFYEYSIALEKSTAKLLQVLGPDAASDKDLADKQALTKQFAEIMDFVLRFDDMKMTNPAIQNDFSYYRRILNRIKLSNKREAGITVGDELANSMSLFFAYPTPMMNSLIKTATQASSELGGAGNDGVSKFLSRMCNSCHAMVVTKKADLSEEVAMLCYRTITGTIILYDHVNPKGAFHKRTPLQIRGAVGVLKAHQGKEKTDSLVNALRFNTVHLNDEDTPGAIKQLLA